MLPYLDIQGKRILLVGFRGNKNLGDELILIGTLRLLLQQGKQPVVVSQDPEFLRDFCSQFLPIKQVKFIRELPRGFRSLGRYLTSKDKSDFCEFYRCDAVILGGGEILTEENPNAYWYWFWSLWGLFLRSKILFYIMGGVQIPRQWFNRLCFRYLERRAKAFYLRDFEGVEALEQRNHQKVSFFMDTSYYARDDRKDFRLVPQKYIILNMNSNAEHFFDEFLAFAKDYQRKGYHLYYVPISKGNDNDLQYYDRLLKDGISPQSLSLLDWETDFLTFLTCLVRAEKVIGTRLHLFLISSFLGVPTEVFPYQKKIGKMQSVLQQLGVI